MRQFCSIPISASVIGSGMMQVVQRDDAGTSRYRGRHRPLRPALAAQQPGEPVASRGDELGGAGLDDLPGAGCSLDGEGVGAEEQGEVGDALDRAAGQIDHERVAEVEARGGPGAQRLGERADGCAPAGGGQQPEGIRGRRAIDRDAAGPRLGPGGEERQVRGDVLAQARQVHEHRGGRSEDDGAAEVGGARRAGRQIVHRAIVEDRLDASALAVGGGDDPQIDEPPVMVEPDHVARIPGEPRGRQAEGRALAARPRPPSAPCGSGAPPPRAAPPPDASRPRHARPAP